MERVVLARIREEHGETAITQKPLISKLTGYNFGDQDVPTNYLQAIEAAERLASTARGMAGEYAREARGQGRTWAEIAGAFGIDSDDVVDPAVEAFQRIVPPDRWGAESTSWTCTSCDTRVTDRGPYEGHPADNETGHATDCTRHQREILAYQTRFDLDQDWEFER
ncbi:hypothetical protein [Nocardia sp. CA-120079]|uniref:hypothetical protein n=1 Tax=Nocardia sp. CA-120079 TaxID=3239974 RepID=UPI003D99E501